MLTPRVDLTGQTFFKIKVDGLSGRSHPGEGKIWTCRCECGTPMEVTTQSLRSGRTKSCGCLRLVRTDLTGLTFNDLCVTEQLHKPNKATRLYRCRCVCGQVVEVTNRDLTQGRVRSCGCGTKALKWKGHGLISGTFWSRMISSAKHREIPVEITIEQAWGVYLTQAGRCALTGTEIVFGKDRYEHVHGFNTASLDRIDSDRGYVPGNIQWVHKTVNLMKQALPQDVFVGFCKKVALHHGLVDPDQGGSVADVA